MAEPYKLPLFERYPGAEKNLPFVSIGSYPTPLEELCGLSERNRIFIKRDDQTNPEYGGNKIRKLEFVLAEAIKQGAEDVITFGCDGSNHCLATGICASRLGLKSHSITRTQPNAEYVRKNLLKSLYYGIKIHHCETLEEMYDTALKMKDESLFRSGKAIYEIPMGGSSPLGNIGFINAALELKQQIDEGLMPEPDYIYVAAGTMGTAAGLILGLDALGMKTKVISVQTTAPERANETTLAQMLCDTAELMHSADSGFPKLEYSPEDVCMIHKFFGGEYALFTEEGMNAVKLMREKYAIQLEGTYTGKTLAALLEADKNEHEGKVILFWDTLNSREPPEAVARCDYHSLPESLWFYFETPVQELDA